MKNKGKQKPLGSRLIEAGVISEEQLKVALEDQRHYNLRIGEILAKHKWVKQRTADFFAREWDIIRKSYPKQPIGYYLRRAALLDETQISYILDEQEKPFKRKFGEIAVKEAWLKPETINFFLDGLNEEISFLNNTQGDQSNIFKKAILYVNDPDIVIIERENIIYELHDVEINFNSEVPELMIC